ncbi:MAG TPA: alpha/beta fold hydrolase [Solirubrobacteraceae bacterium]|nr:alpha/beta fold hydrolase [Solirubrobacteraceae bacterium]
MSSPSHDAHIPAADFEAWQMRLHGHRVIYHMAGSGPPVVLIHGMLNSSWHWREVALRLAEHHTVIAPDLIGHGDSATPRGDYSLGAHAASIRDLLAVLGIERATIVGHSLGGGVAMQFFYQFPQRAERLVLISSGGLGREVSPLLRTATLPGAAAMLSLAAHPRLLSAVRRAGDRMRASGSRRGVYLQAFARALRPLEEPGARKAFLHTLRAVIDAQGQRVSARDRLYLLDRMPTLYVWGERDNTIPLAHGREAQLASPGSRFATIPNAAHFPHLEDPRALAAILADFLATAEPARIEDGEWGHIVAPMAPRSRHESASPA